MKKFIIIAMAGILLLTSCSQNKPDSYSITMRSYNKLDEKTIKREANDQVTYVYEYLFKKPFHQLRTYYKFTNNGKKYYENFFSIDIAMSGDELIEKITKEIMVITLQKDLKQNSLYLYAGIVRSDLTDDSIGSGINISFVNDDNKALVDINSLKLKKEDMTKEIKDYDVHKRVKLGELTYNDAKGNTLVLELSSETAITYDERKTKKE